MRRRKNPAELMHTSRAQVDRILDPHKGNVISRRCNAPPRWSAVNSASSWSDGNRSHQSRFTQLDDRASFVRWQNS